MSAVQCRSRFAGHSTFKLLNDADRAIVLRAATLASHRKRVVSIQRAVINSNFKPVLKSQGVA